ncbi:NF041680 family putative transposase, partial [Streptomyces sp. NPDC058548]|uniref:NF041680 family putative transposase n=1 Tax=Streptomyces sp. NPDC058548 TaxID=3346545 RepID=UPI00364A0182
MSLLHDDVEREPFAEASHFREDFYGCLTARRDELFELADALLCADGPVTSPVDLTLMAEHRRGHGALYDALNRGRLDTGRLRRTLAALPQPRAADDRLVLAVDVSNWLRPDAECSADRLFCHTYGRGRDQHLMIPGWPYSFVAALESGRTSWCQLLDAVRLGPEDDVAEVTAVQVRRVVEDLIAGGRWREGDPDVLIVFDAGYDAPRMAHLLDGLPVEVLGRMRSDRVMRRPTPTQLEYATAYPQGGRPPKHGRESRFAKPETWGEPDTATVQVTDRYGTAKAMAWDRLHPRLTTRSAWIDHDGELPIIEGTLIRLQVDRLPGGGDPLPLWLWSSVTGMTGADVDLRWQAFLRRFDLEHTFRMIKQTLGWTRPKLRTPEAADRWTWLIIVAHTQLRLARPLAEDIRRPWERPTEPNRLTPARVRRG